MNKISINGSIQYKILENISGKLLIHAYFTTHLFDCRLD